VSITIDTAPVDGRCGISHRHTKAANYIQSP
jgi:hypothetical protein